MPKTPCLGYVTKRWNKEKSNIYALRARGKPLFYNQGPKRSTERVAHGSKAYKYSGLPIIRTPKGPRKWAENWADRKSKCSRKTVNVLVLG